MKNILLLMVLGLITTASMSQSWYLNFDNTLPPKEIQFETISNPKCTWQIGSPSKNTFGSAFSTPNSLVTDLKKPVPPNDTSRFLIFHPRAITFNPSHFFELHFWYQLRGDSTDFGTIEISPDEDGNWINLLEQDTTYKLNWMSSKPSLSGSVYKWKYFNLSMTNWASNRGNFPIKMTADIIRFRFTYTTDSNKTAHDGWIIDDIGLEDWWEGVDEIQNDHLISIYPNPVEDKLSIEINQISNNQTIQILNSQGQVLYTNDRFKDNNIDTKNLSNGLYFLRYSDTKSFALKKFMVSH
jgi:hypothetical protein